MSIDYGKAPFPWFGGKSKAAPAVWAALGDVSHYVEPFAGSLAVLINRPHPCNRTYYSETVNDADGLLVNAWRSIQLYPEATAQWASWPVTECDKHARQIALMRWRDEHQLEHLMGDPDWCDPKMAGWWLYGICLQIGGGWCTGEGPWTADESGWLVKQAAKGNGQRRSLPHLTGNGRGVHRSQLREPGVLSDTPDNEFHPLTMPELVRWFQWLSARLRHVRIINGDWQRVCTTGAAKMLEVRQGKGVCGFFLDPPYSAEANRSNGLYAVEDLAVAHQVREWCLKNGDDPDYRIVLAGFSGEHEALESAGWRVVEWYTQGFLCGGYAVGSKDGHQQHRERLWCSPHCLMPDLAPEPNLMFDFAMEEAE